MTVCCKLEKLNFNNIYKYYIIVMTFSKCLIEGFLNILKYKIDIF